MVKTNTDLAIYDPSLYYQKAAFFKFYLLFSVLLTHSLNYEAYGLAEMPGFAATALYRLELLELNISGLVVPMYFFISGYSFMVGYTPDKAADKLKRRFYSMFIPWLLWNTIMWLLCIALEMIPFVAARLNTGFGFELSLHSWFFDGLLFPADNPLWFISNLLVLTLVSPLLYPLVRNKYSGLALICAEFLAVYFLRSSRYDILMTLLFYTQAAYYSQHLSTLVSRSYRRPTRLAAWIILLLYLILCSNPETQDGTIRHALAFSIACPALWIAVGNAKLGPKANTIEPYRFWVYASHYLPLECIEKLCLMIGGVSVAVAGFSWIFSPLLTSAILIAVGYALQKFCNPLWCILTGSSHKRKSGKNAAAPALPQ